MSDTTITAPQTARKPMTEAELAAIPNWGQLAPADKQILGLMLGPKRLSMEAALVHVYPTLSPTQVQGCTQYLTVDPRVRGVLKFAGISIPGAPPDAPAVVLSTERIDLAELWDRREFLDLPPVLGPQSFDAPPTRKINIQKVLAMYFTLARHDMAAAISMTHSTFTPQEIGKICDTIRADKNIQVVLALVGESDGNNQ